LFCLIEYVREISDLNEEERTIENLKRRIQFQDQTLHEQEVALEVLLRRTDRAARRAANDVAANITLSISPVIGRLTAHNREFTPREREIASLVLDGRTSKEIAERLCLTIKAVDFHRMNLRKKLRMGGSSQSLQARLIEMNAGSE
jgi:DNA-binding CsgD family transcriptional regulator